MKMIKRRQNNGKGTPMKEINGRFVVAQRKSIVVSVNGNFIKDLRIVI